MMSSNDLNLEKTKTNANFWLNGSTRKRKAAASDLDEKINSKMFVTEEKMVKEMQTLTLDLENQQTFPQVEMEPIVDKIEIKNEENSDDESENEKDSTETRVELHKLLKDTLKKDDLQDSLITKLCEIERKKLTMQIVPYMPIHPAQLTNSIEKTTDENPKEEDKQQISSNNISDEIKTKDKIHIFKIPSVPTLYTVEEPCETGIKRNSTMKRSYSQSNESNSNLSVTELKHDSGDYSHIPHLQSDYFIVEPTATSLSSALSSSSSSSLSSNGPSIRITEYVENSTPNNNFVNTIDDDDDIDMQSVASSDTGDKMDDD